MLEPQDLSPADEKVLDLLVDGRDSGEPWGRVTTPFAAQATGYSLQYVRERLNRLVEHDHAEKIDDGFYEFRSDPRDSGSREGSHAGRDDAEAGGGER